MVVSSVHIVGDMSDGPQKIEIYQANLEALGAKKIGTFSVECETYYSNPIVFPQQKIFNLVQSSEYPVSAFSVMENGPTIVADSSFESIIATLSNFYSPKKMSRMEVRGQKWTLSDFIIKLGTCTMGASFKASIAEIEYGPCSVPGNCWDLIRDLGRSFCPGPWIQKPHQHLRMNEIYMPVDTIHQYNDIFNSIRKQTPQMQMV